MKQIPALLILLFVYNLSAAEEPSQSGSLQEKPKTVAQELHDSLHHPLAPTSTQLTVISEWHTALLTNNFEAYRKVTIDRAILFGAVSNEQNLRDWMGEVRQSVPTRIMISPPFVTRTGNTLFHAYGCKEGYIREQLISVGTDGKQIWVLDGIWFPDKNHVSCQE